MFSLVYFLPTVFLYFFSLFLHIFSNVHLFQSFEPGTEIVLNQPLMAVFPEPIGRKSSSPVRYQLIDGKNSHLFELQEETGRLFLRQRPFGNPIEQVELEVKVSI